MRRGQKLKIITVERHYKEPEISPDSIAEIQIQPPVEPADSAVVIPDSAIVKEEIKPEPKPQPKTKETKPAAPAKPKAEANKKATSKPSTYKVVSGDNLYKISKRFGVTIDALKKANGMTNDNLSVGQSLKIPSK